jgi:hypothetical protein
VKLTELGWKTAEHWARHGLSEREMRTVTPDTPASVRHAGLTREISACRGALPYAEGTGDKQLEAKLLAEIAESERELGSLAASVKRARAEAVVRDYPDSPLAERFRGMLKHPDFFENVVALNVVFKARAKK